MPFEEWGSQQATKHATEHVRSLLDRQALLGEYLTVGSGRIDVSKLTESNSPGPTEPSIDGALDTGPIVYHVHHYDRQGNLVDQPAVSFQSVVEATPRSGAVTMLFPERAYTATLPVLCERTWVQNG